MTGVPDDGHWREWIQAQFLAATGGAALVLWIAAGALGGLLLGVDFEDPNIGQLLAVTGLQNALIVLLFAVPLVPRAGHWKASDALLGLGLFTLFLPVWTLGTKLYLQGLAAGGVEVPTQPQLVWFKSPEFIPLWLGCAIVVGVGPIGEEMVFRHWLQPGLAGLMNRWSALFLTSALFGLLHGPYHALPIAVLGGFYGWLRLWTGGMAAPVAAHIANNGAAVAVYLMWPDAGGAPSGP